MPVPNKNEKIHYKKLKRRLKYVFRNRDAIALIRSVNSDPKKNWATQPAAP